MFSGLKKKYFQKIFPDGPSPTPAVTAYKASYGLSSSYYSSPKLAISAPTVSKVIAAPAVATYSTPTITSAAYSAAPAVSSYYSTNKLAYGGLAPVKQVSYSSPAAITQYTSAPYSNAYGIKLY